MAIFGMVSTRDSLDYTQLAIDSFFKETELSDTDRFLLIDNDKSINPSNLTFPDKVEVKVNKSPLGFASNANQCIDIALGGETDLYLLNNDVIFTKNWYKILKEAPADTVCTPFSNRELEYISSVSSVRANKVVTSLHCAPPPLSAKHYIDRPGHLEPIVEAHAQAVQGMFYVLHMPFFCVRLPIHVLRIIGKFDEEYGQGGGEDFDYCLRCHLANCPVGYASASYMLHFGGKSTYASESEKDRQKAREKHFREIFQNKWGEELHKILMDEDASILDQQPELKKILEERKTGDFVRKLMINPNVAIHI